MLITRRYELDMGHCLPDHLGKCYRPHGHRYVVEATVQGITVLKRGDPERGMVADFGRVKEAMAAVLDQYDHRFVVCLDDPRLDAIVAAFGNDGLVTLEMPPTAECLAVVWGFDLDALLPIKSLRVYETPNCWADCEIGR